MPLLTTQSAKGFGFGTLVAPTITNAYVSLANVVVSSATSAVEITSIPTTGYRHLEVRGIWTGTGTSAVSLVFQVNGDTGNNYYSHYSYGNGFDMSGGNYSQINSGSVAYRSSTNQGTYDTTAFVLKIPDYVSTTKKFSFMSIEGRAAGSLSNHNEYNTGVYSTTGAAITSLKFFCLGGGGINIEANSRFSVYGIKG
jgi:hypothetical protein